MDGKDYQVLLGGKDKMVLKLKDKTKGIMTYRTTPNGAVLTKGKRQLFIIFRTVNQSKKAKEIITKHKEKKVAKISKLVAKKKARKKTPKK